MKGKPMERIILEWEVPKDFPNFTGHDDIAEAYRIYENPKACSGIVVEAKYRGEWEANPFSTRALIRHLMDLIDSGPLLEFYPPTNPSPGR